MTTPPYSTYQRSQERSPWKILGITVPCALVLHALVFTALIWPGWLIGEGGIIPAEKETAYIDQVTDEFLNSFKDNVEDHYTGNSRAFREEPLPGIVVSARENAFEQDTEVKVGEVSDEEFAQVTKLFEDKPSHEQFLFALRVDAGLQPDDVIPGKYKMEFDLNKMGLPKELHHAVRLYRIDDAGEVYPYHTVLNDGVISYESSQNGLCAVSVAVAAYVWSKIGVYGLIGLSGLGWVAWKYQRDASISTYFKDAKDAVMIQVKDDFGDFNVGFNISETEDFARKDIYISKLDSIERQITRLEREVRLSFKERESSKSTATKFRAWLRSWQKSDKQQDQEAKMTEQEIILADMIADDPLIKRLVKDPDAQPPESVEKIIKMVKLALRFLRTDQQSKTPSYVIDILLVNGNYPEFQGKDMEGMRLCNVGHKDYIAINYPKMLRAKGDSKTQKEVNTNELDRMGTTITHEMFHACQSEYTTVYAIETDMRFMEATAAVLEPQFAKWLRKELEITYDPVAEWKNGNNRFGFTSRQHKEWVAATLTHPITQEKKPWEYVEKELAAANNDYMAKKKALALDDHKGRAKLWEEYRSNIAKVWAGTEDPNVDAGYMLADFIQHLMDRKGTVTCAKLMEKYSMLRGFHGSLMDAFDVKSEEVFFGFYEEFCLKYIEKIRLEQSNMSADADGKRFFYHLFEPRYDISPEKCVYQLQRFGDPGAYSCRVYEFFSTTNKPYHLFLLPTEDISTDAVKIALMKNDSTYADDIHFMQQTDPDPKTRRQVCAVQYFTPEIAHQTFNAESKVTAVVMFAPDNPVIVKGASEDGRGLTMCANNTAPEPLVKNHVLSGMQILIQNVRGDSLYTGQLTVEDLNRDITVPWEWIGTDASEAKDLKVSARWYYRVPTDPMTVYYGPSTDLIDFKAEGKKEEKKETGGKMLVDQNFELKKILELDWGELTSGEGSAEMGSSASKFGGKILAHVTVDSDGHFSVTTHAQHVPISATEGSNTVHMDLSIPAISIKGKGTVTDKGSYYQLTMDETSFEQSDISSHAEMTASEYCDTHERSEKEYYLRDYSYDIRNMKYYGSDRTDFTIEKDSSGKPRKFFLRLKSHKTGVEKEQSTDSADGKMVTKEIDEQQSITFDGFVP